MKENPKFRDFLAFPFAVLAGAMIVVCLSIGGKWTAKRILILFNKL